MYVVYGSITLINLSKEIIFFKSSKNALMKSSFIFILMNNYQFYGVNFIFWVKDDIVKILNVFGFIGITKVLHSNNFRVSFVNLNYKF